jgi:hypothetical protein
MKGDRPKYLTRALKRLLEESGSALRSEKTLAAEFSARLLRDVDDALYHIPQGRQRPETTIDRADADERGGAQPELTSIGRAL